jgi:hypothetical protein
MKIDLLLLPRGQNPLSYYYTSIMNLKIISLRALVGKAKKETLLLGCS